MEEQGFASGRLNIGQPVNPEMYVHFMDILNSIEWFQKHKRKGFESVNIKTGDHVLDVGCGTGYDAQELAKMVGEKGKIVAVDLSEHMLDVARQRNKHNLPIEFRSGDINHLDLPDNSFDGSLCYGTFEILETPGKALNEMIRVTKSGGHIVVSGPDLETMLINSSDRQLTRKFFNSFCDIPCNGWIGRQLPGYYKKAGLVDIKIIPDTLVIDDFSLFNQLWLLPIISNALMNEIVTEAEAADWLEKMEAASQDGSFLFATTGFIIIGRKP
jgi:ubiquinone/menaquinone biosynthesis C-methylase UbiE